MDVEWKMVTEVLQHAAEALAKENPDLTVRALIALTAVAKEEGQGPRHYHETTGLPESTMSRLLLDLTGLPTRRKDSEGRRVPGVGFLEQRGDPEMLSKVAYYLTPKGKNLFRRLASTARKAA